MPEATARLGKVSDRQVGLLIAGLILLGLLLRLPSFTDALFGDELSTYFVVHGNDLGRMFDLIHSDQELSPPLYYLFASLTQHLGEASDWLRLPSLLAGLAAIPLTYALGRRLASRPAALLAATLIALSPFLIFYSTEARGYALAMLLSLLSTFTMLRAIDDERPRWWLAYAVFAAAAMYTHYTCLFLLAGQAGWALVARPKARLRLIVASLGAAVAFLPWMPEYVDDSRSSSATLIEILSPFTLEVFRVELSRMAFGHPFIELSDLPGDLVLAAIGLALVAGLPTFAVTAWQRRGRLPSLTALVIVLAAAPPVGAALYSLTSTSVFNPRNLITAWPGWALLVGVIVMAARGWVRVAAVTAVCGGFGIGAVLMLDRDNQRGDYDAAARYLEAEGSPGDPIVDVPFTTPGAKQALEVALGDLGIDDRPVLRVGMARLEDAIAVRAPDGPGPLGPVPIPPGDEIAREALDAASGGPLFVVAAGTLSFEAFEASAQGELDQFLEALPADYRAVSTAHFPGLGFTPVTVYELEAAASPD